MSVSLLRTATDAAYVAAKELGKASVLSDVPDRQAECLNAAADDLRLALSLIERFQNAPVAVSPHPIFVGILADFGLPTTTRKAA